MVSYVNIDNTVIVQIELAAENKQVWTPKMRIERDKRQIEGK